MSKIIKYGLLVLLLIISLVGWFLFGPSIANKNNSYLEIPTGSNMSFVEKELVRKNYLSSISNFHSVAQFMHFKTVKAGRYKIANGTSLFSLIKSLKNGNQSPVNLIITKLRTPEQLAGKIDKTTETDSLTFFHFLKNIDSLKKYNLDTNSVMASILPNTYSMNWNSTTPKIFQQFYNFYKKFWTNERKQKAESLHLLPVQIITLASIVEEETNLKTDKPKIASTYLNRLKKNMPLQADPTIKFALKDFGLKRILFSHLKVSSPYNTYTHTGLPPGPICTPSLETIDAVLNAPVTDYLYFVANSNFDGSSLFTSNIQQHQINAQAYQNALTKMLAEKKLK